jgi:hypothetical protein
MNSVSSWSAVLTDATNSVYRPATFRCGDALTSNRDAPIVKENNLYWHDWSGPRVYFPWDLDSTMNVSMSIFTGTVQWSRSDAARR